MHTWSTQQDDIFEWFSTGRAHGAASPHLIVRARAGTGKSTTIREGVTRAPERAILIAAFSKNIQLDMEQRLAAAPQRFSGRVQTLHAVGFACVRQFRERVKVEFGLARADGLAQRVCQRSDPDEIVRLVAKLCTKGREIAPHAAQPGDLEAIQVTFECEVPDAWVGQGFTSAYIEGRALAAMALAAEVTSGELIDGSDMIFLPVRNHWLTPQFDLVVVDEAQDMTTAQLEIAQGVLRPGGRICVVGDDRQAIFGFRGADSRSLDRLKAELRAAELGLTTTYRCAQAIVRLAQEYVPDIEAGPNNPEGVIEHLDLRSLTAAAGPGDFILSRLNAPLVSVAMKCLRAGKRTQVAGRDIGQGLVTLIRRLKARSVPELLERIEGWMTREQRRHRAQLEAASPSRRAALVAKVEAVEDQANTLSTLTEGATSVAAVEGVITRLFTDDGLGAAGLITCSSVHKAKGLEADRVFILRDTLRDTTQEAENIAYVAITRAKHTLVWVTNPRRV